MLAIVAAAGSRLAPNEEEGEEEDDERWKAGYKINNK